VPTDQAVLTIKIKDDGVGVGVPPVPGMAHPLAMAGGVAAPGMPGFPFAGGFDAVSRTLFNQQLGLASSAASLLPMADTFQTSIGAVSKSLGDFADLIGVAVEESRAGFESFDLMLQTTVAKQNERLASDSQHRAAVEEFNALRDLKNRGVALGKELREEYERLLNATTYGLTKPTAKFNPQQGPSYERPNVGTAPSKSIPLADPKPFYGVYGFANDGGPPDLPPIPLAANDRGIPRGVPVYGFEKAKNIQVIPRAEPVPPDVLRKEWEARNQPVADKFTKRLALATEGVDHFSAGVRQFAANDYLGGVRTSSSAAAKALGLIPVVGKPAAAALQLTTASVLGFANIVNGFVARGRELSNINGVLAGAAAAADVRTLLADLREAKVAGPAYAKLIENANRFDVATRDAFLPAKTAIAEELAKAMAVLTRIAEQLGPIVSAVTTGVVDAKNWVMRQINDNSMTNVLKDISRKNDALADMLRQIEAWVAQAQANKDKNELNDLMQQVLDVSAGLPTVASPMDMMGLAAQQQLERPLLNFQ